MRAATSQPEQLRLLLPRPWNNNRCIVVTTIIHIIINIKSELMFCFAERGGAARATSQSKFGCVKEG